MSEYVQVSTGDQWVTGTSYRLTYAVDHIQLFGWDVPDELIPDATREYLAKKQIDQTVTKLESDPRWEVQGYEYYGTTFTIDLVARDNPFPIALVVVGIIGVALLFGIALVISKVEAVVESVGTTADKLGPVGKFSISASLLIAVSVAAFILVKREV